MPDRYFCTSIGSFAMVDPPADGLFGWVSSPYPEHFPRRTSGLRRDLDASPRARVSAEAGPLLDPQAGDGPGDHQLLDLLGALEDVEDLGVTVPALDRILPHVAVAT